MKIWKFSNLPLFFPRSTISTELKNAKKSFVSCSLGEMCGFQTLFGETRDRSCLSISDIAIKTAHPYHAAERHFGDEIWENSIFPSLPPQLYHIGQVQKCKKSFVSCSLGEMCGFQTLFGESWDRSCLLIFDIARKTAHP